MSNPAKHRDWDWQSPLQGIQKTWMSSLPILPHGAYAGHLVGVFKLTCDKLFTDWQNKEGQFPMHCLLFKHQEVSNVQERLGLYYIALKAVIESSSSTYPSILSKLFATQSSESIKHRFTNILVLKLHLHDTENCTSLGSQATHLCQKHPFASLPT